MQKGTGLCYCGTPHVGAFKLFLYTLHVCMLLGTCAHALAYLYMYV